MRIVAISCIGPGEQYLKESLDDIARLRPDEVLIACNNTDQKTEREIKKRGFQFYRDDREWGKFQPYIKGDLLRRAGDLKPDWILAKDADEIYDPALNREGLEEMANKGGVGWYFYIVNLWGDEDCYHPGLSFWNIRFYRFAPEYGLEFQKTPVHCGWAPPMAYSWGNYAPYMHLHYGLMGIETRRRKIARYESYDPRAIYKDRSYYEALKEEKAGVPLNRDEMRAKIKNEVEKYKVKNSPAAQEPEGFCYMEKDGRVIDVPAKDARRYEKQGFTFVSNINVRKANTAEAPVVKAEPEPEPQPAAEEPKAEETTETAEVKPDELQSGIAGEPRIGRAVSKPAPKAGKPGRARKS